MPYRLHSKPEKVQALLARLVRQAEHLHNLATWVSALNGQPSLNGEPVDSKALAESLRTMASDLLRHAHKLDVPDQQNIEEPVITQARFSAEVAESYLAAPFDYALKH